MSAVSARSNLIISASVRVVDGESGGVNRSDGGLVTSSAGVGTVSEVLGVPVSATAVWKAPPIRQATSSRLNVENAM
ncbi:hypothetical protein Mapa_005590 [Marchantia paleacea]|nr:hypothetical protein Mapa_005590 [Marchantia paleacea]